MGGPSVVDRRRFLRSGALAGAALAAGSSGCGSALDPGAAAHGEPGAAAIPEPLGTAPEPRRGAAIGQPPEPFALEEISIGGLADAIASGAQTSRSVTQAYLARIAEIDRLGPTLRSVIETNPDALDIAEALDREQSAGRVRSPLHGVPVLVKDNIDTADRMTTTAGSLALAGSIPPEDSHVAQRLREAGVVLLGKANLSEWANFRSTRSSSGWSARGGQCRNPYALDRNPCGSSSGSGAAVSANLAAAAIGTETDGSIVCPSTANGIVGIKPTVGLVSRAGIVPISETQDTAGPMARSVRDAALLLGAIAGPDPRDPATAPGETLGLDDYTPFLDADGLRGARIGVQRSVFGFHEAVDRLMEEAIAVLRDRGAVIVDPIDLAASGALRRAETEVLFYEFKAGLNAYLQNLRNPPIRSLADLIAFNERHADEELAYFGQERLIAAQSRGSLSSMEYRRAHATARRLSRAAGIDRVMDGGSLDAILAPTGGPAWVTDLVNGDHFGGSSSQFAAAAGYPNVTVPAGFVHGLPVGVSFFGRAWSEPTLIRIAYAFEQATRHRRAPRLLATADVPA
ncbi:MAG: amidase [Acidobacteria bacterium]|nr:amidase [Acidobacteriota bacterium]